MSALVFILTIYVYVGEKKKLLIISAEKYSNNKNYNI